MNGEVTQHAMDSHKKMQITVLYVDYLVLVEKSAVLVVPIWAYNLVYGLPWFHKQNPDNNSTHHQFTSL